MASEAPWRALHPASVAVNLLFAFPGTLLLLSMVGSAGAPPIHDITTDTANPPTFTAAPQLRGEGANTLEIKPGFITEQQKAYPDLQGLRTDLSVAEAFDLPRWPTRSPQRRPP